VVGPNLSCGDGSRCGLGPRRAGSVCLGTAHSTGDTAFARCSGRNQPLGRALQVALCTSETLRRPHLVRPHSVGLSRRSFLPERPRSGRFRVRWIRRGRQPAVRRTGHALRVPGGVVAMCARRALPLRRVGWLRARGASGGALRPITQSACRPRRRRNETRCRGSWQWLAGDTEMPG